MTRFNRELTVGVIGGMGPYATLAFFQCLLDHTPARKDWDHLHIVIDNNPKIPSRTRAFLFDEEDPVPMMVESANRLRDSGADFVVVPCNSAHYYLARVRERTSIPFIDMIDETCQAILAKGAKAVGLLAAEVTVGGGLYEQRLNPRGVEVHQVTEQQQELVRAVIEDVKQNRVGEETRSTMQILIDSLEARGVDTIVLGCTELPLAMAGVVTRSAIVDSTAVLAEAVVRVAKSGAMPPVGRPE